MILREILITNKGRITDNGIEMRIFSKLRLAICEKVSRFNGGSVCFVHRKNALYCFLCFFWIKLNTLRQMSYCFSLSAALDKSFYSRGKDNAITAAWLQHSGIRRLNGPVSEKIRNWLRSIIAASKFLIRRCWFHTITFYKF